MNELNAAIVDHSRVVDEVMEDLRHAVGSGNLTVWDKAEALACLLDTTKRLGDLKNRVFDRQSLEASAVS